MSKHHYLFIALGAAAVGFYLAGAASQTGIYSTPVGNTLANLWTSGNNVALGGSGANPA